MSTLRQAWTTMAEGTIRTLKWVAGGMRGSKDGTPDASASAPIESSTADKTLGERLEQRTGHSQRTIGLAIGAGLIVCLWIGWTAYVWTENGSTAGIGVLVTWPAVLAAVTLVTAPFIGGAVAVRRHRAGEPVLAGAIAPAEPAPAPPAQEKVEDSEEEKPEADAAEESPEDETPQVDDAGSNDAGDPEDTGS